MSARPLLTFTWWTVKCTFVLFQPTYTIQVYDGATTLQCLFLSAVEIKQQSHGKCYDSPFQLFLDTAINTHPLLNSRTTMHITHTAAREVLGWVCMDTRVLHFPNTSYNKLLLITPKEYKSNILNNKLENKTVLQRPSWTVQRKFQLYPPEKLKNCCWTHETLRNYIHCNNSHYFSSNTEASGC